MMIYYQLFTYKDGALGRHCTEILSLGPNSGKVDWVTNARWKNLDGKPLAKDSDVCWVYVEVEDTSL